MNHHEHLQWSVRNASDKETHCCETGCGDEILSGKIVARLPDGRMLCSKCGRKRVAELDRKEGGS